MASRQEEWRMTAVAEFSVETDLYVLRLAVQAEDLRWAQRLRFEVFNLELGEGLASSVETGLDRDPFDAVCDHLVVTERQSGAVVGTYRLQTGEMARAGLGYYSGQEFCTEVFDAARGELVELGRACVAAGHRNQTVLGLLWRGIARYARERGARYLMGCSSLTSRSPAVGVAAYRQLHARHLVEVPWRTWPRAGWACETTEQAVADVGAVPIPRLLAAYLAIGARICGAPALDREFGTIDFLTWLDLETMPPRVLRRFLN